MGERVSERIGTVSGADNSGGVGRVPISKRRTPSLPTIVFLALALSFAIFLAVRFDVDAEAVWRDLARSDPLLYVAALALYYCSVLVRGARWRVILRNVGPQEMQAVVPSVIQSSRYILLARFADSMAWIRVGNIYRAYLASDSSAGSFPRAVGTIVAEHFLDMLTMAAALLVLVVMAASAVSAPVSSVVTLTVAMTALAVFGLAVMRRFGARLAVRLPRRLREVYVHFQRGTLGSLGFRQLPPLLALSLVAWLCAVGRWYFVLAALDISLSLPMLVFISLVNALLATVPLTPGGLGVVEPGVAGVLMLTLSP